MVVIDEVQMIEDRERGFAWTRALLGLRCKEIHCCGGNEAIALVQKIAHACNDDFIVKQYERFSKLTVAERTLASYPDEGGSYRWVCSLVSFLDATFFELSSSTLDVWVTNYYKFSILALLLHRSNLVIVW